MEEQIVNLNDYKIRLEQMFDAFNGGIKKIKDIENGDLIPIQAWIDSCHDGSFIDYDGYGNLAVQLSDGDWIVGTPTIYPSDISLRNLNISKNWTHVLWYNR